MHVALIVDEERLVHEHATLNRLAVGLISEGVQLTRVIPEASITGTVVESEERVALAARLQTPMRVLPWLRGERRERLLEAFERTPPEVLYAVGVGAWDIGRDLARSLDVALAIDIWSAAQARRAPRGRAATSVGGYVVPTAPMAEDLRKRVDPNLVCVVPPGVAVPPEPREILADPEASITLAIVGRGQDVSAYHALLNGLARVVRERPQVQIFLELRGPDEHEIWRHARRLDLLSNLSTITDAAQHRSLLTRCDVLLIPERSGELRSLVLEAMAYGMAVVAAADPFLDMLVDRETALLVSDPDADEWARRVGGLLDDSAEARRIGLAARDHMTQHFRSSDHVTRLRHVLARIASEGPYPFEEPAA